MKRTIAVSALMLCLLTGPIVFAQMDSIPKRILSVQPIVWLDNFVPTDLIGFSGQYEHGVSMNQSLVARLVWFRDPIAADDRNVSEGYATSVEFRFYLSASTQGWHLAPFVELARYRHIPALRFIYGSGMKTTYDFGVLAGHKWVSDRLSFDISVRTAWYSPATYPEGRFFPSGEHQLNSYMLISLGYGI
jgi:hypothetical protein